MPRRRPARKPSRQEEDNTFDETLGLVDLEDLESGDIVIAVMGPTGSGKSTLIQATSGYDTQGVGNSLRSFTDKVVAIRFWDEQSKQHVVLVDTPGFNDTYNSDLKTLEMISKWLISSYGNHKLLSAIWYLHRITDNRVAGTSLKNLQVFRKLCGRNALDKVYFITTMWDEVEEEVGEKRLEELIDVYWRRMIDRGARVKRCRSDDGSPKQRLREVLGDVDVRRALRLQKEMVKLKMALNETAAGQKLCSQLEALVERQVAVLRRIEEEKKTAAEANVLAALQMEYDDLRAQVDNRVRQIQELKLSRLSFRRLFTWGWDQVFFR